MINISITKLQKEIVKDLEFNGLTATSFEFYMNRLIQEERKEQALHYKHIKELDDRKRLYDFIIPCG